MILSLDALREREFALSGIHAILQRPSYRSLSVKKRSCNGFLYITQGNCRYAFAGGEFALSPGSVVYLPMESRHELTITSEAIEFYRVDFTLKAEGELVFFSDSPLKLTGDASQKCGEAIRALEAECRFENSTVAKTELLCAVFRELQKHTESRRHARLQPAVQELHAHLTEGIDCRKLAALCYLSTAQFYQLFRAEYGMTPLAYRDALLVRRAEILLASGEVSVGEAAELLGFSALAYFSRFFKKHTGVSPTAYARA